MCDQDLQMLWLMPVELRTFVKAFITERGNQGKKKIFFSFLIWVLREEKFVKIIRKKIVTIFSCGIDKLLFCHWYRHSQSLVCRQEASFLALEFKIRYFQFEFLSQYIKRRFYYEWLVEQTRSWEKEIYWGNLHF